ncbi:hypothetical protein ABZ027_27110 [Streptomyces sp. NPDC006332]|uniref:hypothetical protein n=1 Tax=Streptomyces sp. NPDC006332 TaxID=3155456 RepID=UPI0033AFE825
MRKTAVGSLLVLLLGAGSCTSGNGDGDEDGTEATAGEQTTCEQLLGASGVDWVKNSTKDKTGVATDSETLKSARSLFYSYAKAWSPKSSEIPMFTNSELCRVLKTAGASGNKNLSIHYGASIVPFHEKSGASEAGTATAVNADVKLVHKTARNGTAKYYVYIKCRVSGAPEGQENEVPIEGVMNDTLTGDTDTRTHMKYLLHSAGVVARSFDCKNNPTVPADPPTAVK